MDGKGFDRRYGISKNNSEPSVISDGADGIITGWRYAASSFSVAGKAQRIDVDGNKVFDEEGVLLEDLPVICTDQGKKSLYTAYSLEIWRENTFLFANMTKKGVLFGRMMKYLPNTPPNSLYMD